MFNPLENNDEFKLEENLSQFLAKYFNTYLDEDPMSKVLEGCPFPTSDSLQVPKMDDEWVDLLEEDKRNVPLLKSDKNMSRIQGTLLKTMAPLAQFWTTLDQKEKNCRYCD